MKAVKVRATFDERIHISVIFNNCLFYKDSQLPRRLCQFFVCVCVCFSKHWHVINSNITVEKKITFDRNLLCIVAGIFVWNAKSYKDRILFKNKRKRRKKTIFCTILVQAVNLKWHLTLCAFPDNQIYLSKFLHTSKLYLSDERVMC